MNLQRKVGIGTLIPFTLFAALLPTYFHLGQTNLLVNTIMSICVALTIGLGSWALKLDTDSKNGEHA